ncbi:MAG: hypothetical protein L0H23_05275 [Luteimonas sp.]|nr:hypothetical protein [Luteimonas sp.]
MTTPDGGIVEDHATVVPRDSQARRTDITASTPDEALAPWQRLQGERLEQLTPSLAIEAPPGSVLIECGTCRLRAAVHLAKSVPSRSLRIFRRSLQLRAPQCPPQADGGFDAMALDENPSLLEPWLADLASALPRAEPGKDFNRWSLCRWQVLLIVPDSGTENGFQEIYMECDIPEHLAEIRAGLLGSPFSVRAPLLAPLRERGHGPSSWGPWALLGLRSWADEHNVTIDELNLSAPELPRPTDDDREPLFRVVLPRRELLEAVEKAYRVLWTVQDRIDRVFDRHAPKGLRS